MFVLRKCTAGEILYDNFFFNLGSVMPVVASFTAGTSVCRWITYILHICR